MISHAEVPVGEPKMPPARQRVLSWPATQLGRWSVWLGAGFAILFGINVTVLPPFWDAPQRSMLLPVYGICMLGTGLAAGVVGLVAGLRSHERSLLVWLMMLPGLFVVVFLLGEILGPDH